MSWRFFFRKRIQQELSMNSVCEIPRFMWVPLHSVLACRPKTRVTRSFRPTDSGKVISVYIRWQYYNKNHTFSTGSFPFSSFNFLPFLPAFRSADVITLMAFSCASEYVGSGLTTTISKHNYWKIYYVGLPTRTSFFSELMQLEQVQKSSTEWKKSNQTQKTRFKQTSQEFKHKNVENSSTERRKLMYLPPRRTGR